MKGLLAAVLSANLIILSNQFKENPNLQIVDVYNIGLFCSIVNISKKDTCTKHNNFILLPPDNRTQSLIERFPPLSCTFLHILSY